MEPRSKMLFSSKVSIVGLFAVLSFILTVPLAVLLSQQRQDMRSSAFEAPVPPANPLSEASGLGSIAGYVFVDQNQNGERETDEKPLSDVTIKISQVGKADDFGKQTNVVTDVQTDANGYFVYNFSNTTPDAMTYLVKLVLPDGYKTVSTNPVVFSELHQNAREITQFGLFPSSPLQTKTNSVSENAKPTPSCMTRPACLDATPKCVVDEPIGGWCPTAD